MPEPSHIDPETAALLVMDYQVDMSVSGFSASASGGRLLRVDLCLQRQHVP
jgi:hypothetical protein